MSAKSLMRSMLRRFGAKDSGAAAIEFAILMPVLILFVLATYGLGLAVHHVSSVSYALEDTARTLLLNPTLTQSDLQTVLNSKLAPLGNTTVSLTKTLAKGVADSDIAVLTVTYNFSIKVPFVATYNGSYSRSANVFLTVPPA